jgi:ankyrin repeat protein
MFSFLEAVAGFTPLFYSAFSGESATAIYLIDHGADPLAGKLWSPLHGAAANGLSLSKEVYFQSTHSSHILRHT